MSEREPNKLFQALSTSLVTLAIIGVLVLTWYLFYVKPFARQRVDVMPRINADLTGELVFDRAMFLVEDHVFPAGSDPMPESGPAYEADPAAWPQIAGWIGPGTRFKLVSMVWHETDDAGGYLIGQIRWIDGPHAGRIFKFHGSALLSPEAELAQRYQLKPGFSAHRPADNPPVPGA